MKEKTIVIPEPGLHPEAVSNLVQLAGTYVSSLSITYHGKTVDLKSILGVLSLGIPARTEIKIIADGEDETDALENITDYFNKQKSA
ncbi:HPr family phosphocarrier protein [Evansella sp. LMS18]|uniref:HPr family phosphocarrier protein n=1 Tax=Evansella sp. LMS18 TaxID=2924033 RepID=UPI0020D0CACF|nr:HPr family phosphocarrier protein [Evansella sp. LMS18]UTR10538.1 HPr family phosphocarrier protein [Evansella sp. LMS18]